MKRPPARPLILAFDSAGSACSVAVAIGGTVICAERFATMHGQTEALLPVIDAVMQRARVRARELDLIATTIGPGGFTGIRVGIAAARGIGLATNAQLIGVTGFEAVAARVVPPALDFTSFLLISLESRREDLYVQLFDSAGHPVGEAQAVMPATLASVVINATALVIAGDAAERAALLLSRGPPITVVEHSAPDAIGVLQAALRRGWPCKQDDSLRPFYLRPPDVTISSARQRTTISRP